MAAVSDGFAQRGVSTLRYQFPYLEAGSKRVDRPAAGPSHGSGGCDGRRHFRPALRRRQVIRRTDDLAGAGDRSIARHSGLVFFGFPLHPAGKPSIDRAAHLSGIHVPMLFFQGTRDTLADMGLIETVVDDLGVGATLFTVAAADHGFHVSAKTGLTDAEILEPVLSETAAWMRRIVGEGSG